MGAVGTYLTQRASYQREFEERLAVTRRQAYVEWLREVHDVFVLVRAAWTDNPMPPAESRWRACREISPSAAQAALEALRLVASDSAAAAAARLWDHMRRPEVAISGMGTKADFVAWRRLYWMLRHSFVDAARLDIGLEPLEWENSQPG